MIFVLYLLSLLVIQSNATVTCSYSSTDNTLTCGDQTCNTVHFTDPLILPAGYYIIGPETVLHSMGWLNLYSYTIVDGHVWDYYTQVPSLGCKSNFALQEGTQHNGQNSGSITISDNTCWNNIYNVITATITSRDKMDECEECYKGNCDGGIDYNTKVRTTYDAILVAN